MKWINSEFEEGLVSVIVPTYNRAVLLEEAVNSIYTQSYRPIECIVVDDGSKDDTDETMKRLSLLNDHVFSLVYLKQQNSGAQTARNTGTLAARGEFIQYLDSDDLLFPEKLKHQIAYLQQHAICDGVFGDWEKGSPGETELVNAYISKDMIFQLLAEKPIANFSFLMRSSLIKQIGEWDINLKRNQEIDYHLRGIMVGAIYHHQADVTGLWRTHEGDRIFNKTNFSSAIAFYHKWETILKEKALWTNRFQHGVAGNYIWFLQTSPNANREEMVKLLQEIKRLQPNHAIFNSYKFKIIQLLLGERVAMRAWVGRYNQRKT